MYGLPDRSLVPLFSRTLVFEAITAAYRGGEGHHLCYQAHLLQQFPFCAWPGLRNLCTVFLGFLAQIQNRMECKSAQSSSQSYVCTSWILQSIQVCCGPRLSLETANILLVQAGIRAFIVDYAPTHQQEDANSWAGRITGVGNILGYLSGYVNLPDIFPWLGNTQFKVLCVIASVSLCGTVIVTTSYIRERDPRLEGPPSEPDAGILSFFRQVFNSIRRLPPQSRKVCEVQFFNWMGWFGFLFYVTTWIGQLHVNPYFASHPDLTPAEIDKAWEDATRIGTFALLIFAITSFASNILLPFLVIPSYRPPPPRTPSTSPHPTPGTPGTLSASLTSFFPPAPSPSANLHARLTRLLDLCQIKWLTLRRAWLLSHILFALCMASTFFISTPTQATVLAGIVGLPWALSLWAPFALISAEISKRDSEARRRGPHSGDKPEDQAGVILGLHNVAVAAPQIVSTLVSSAIFKLAQKQRGEPYDNSVGWVLRFGGLAALVAAVFTWRIREDAEPVKGNAGKRERGIGEEERGLRDEQVEESV